MKTVSTSVKRFATGLQYPLIALALIHSYAPGAAAQDHSAMQMANPSEMTLEQQAGANTLLKTVRDATEQYKDVKVAIAHGYAQQFGCVAGDDLGAMGVHYINGDLVASGVLDPTRPQIVIYEPMPDGTMHLIGADFLVLANQWNATHTDPPQLMGQLFHLFTAPNRFGLPPFYTLHVWAWKQNPKGTFVNWHSQVSCTAFTEKKQ
jgi:hypothetical protein